MESHITKRASVLVASFGLFLALTPAFGQTQAGKKFQPLNVKTGLWQTTTIYKTTGEMPLPPGTLEKLTPEQRAQIEAMKGTGQTQTLSDKHCVTQQELQNPFNGEHCTWTILESNGSSAKGKVACEEQGMRMTGAGEFEAQDSAHMKGTAHLTSSGSGRTLTTDATFTSKWVGANCGSVQ